MTLLKTIVGNSNNKRQSMHWIINRITTIISIKLKRKHSSHCVQAYILEVDKKEKV